MNPLAFSTVVPAGDAGSRLLAMIAESGFDGVEPTFTPDDTWPSMSKPQLTAEALRRVAEGQGLKIPSMRGGPGFWPTFGAADRAQRDCAVELAEQALAVVREMGGDTLLIVPGRWDADQRYDEFWGHALDTARRVAELAAKHQIAVALENVENRFPLSPSEWKLFLDQIDSPWVRMYFDVGNVVRNAQGHPHQWLRQLGSDYVRRVHFKDARSDGTLAYLLEGDVDWAAAQQALAEIGYRDWVGVEIDLPTHRPAAMLWGTRIAARAILEPNAKLSDD